MVDKLYRWRGTDQRWVECSPNRIRELEAAALADPSLEVRLMRVSPKQKLAFVLINQSWIEIWDMEHDIRKYATAGEGAYEHAKKWAVSRGYTLC